MKQLKTKPWRECRIGFLFLALAAGGAMAADAPEPPSYWTGPMQGDVPALLAGGRVVETKDLAAMLERGGLVLVDVAPPPHQRDDRPTDGVWKPVAHRNIAGSIWLPGVGAGEIEKNVETAFRELLARLTGDDFDRALVFYCHRQCWASWNAAKRAISFGYRDVSWYKDGVEGWQDAGRSLAPAEMETPLF